MTTDKPDNTDNTDGRDKIDKAIKRLYDDMEQLSAIKRECLQWSIVYLDRLIK